MKIPACGDFFYMSTQQPTDGHFREPTRWTAAVDLIQLHDLSDLACRLMKPLGPKKVGSIASTPAHKYLSHQWQKDLLTIIMSFVSQIEVVCVCVRERERERERREGERERGKGKQFSTFGSENWAEKWFLTSKQHQNSCKQFLWEL